ncbi:MAG: response regulator [Desulfobacca sp.]|nr:response regulator [Desulfobacca sp.]
MVVDDVPAIRQMLCQMLIQMGVEGMIKEARDGLEAMEQIKETKFDCIICDISMPRMNGIELLKWLRNTEEHRHTPFLMITGEVSEETVAAAVESDVDSYLLKPFHLSALQSRISEIIRKNCEPSPWETILRQAQKYKNNNEFNQAIQELLKLCNPPYQKHAKVLNLISECYLKLGEPTKAEEFLMAALEQESRSS